jgi:Rieske Fe-S protein
MHACGVPPALEFVRDVLDCPCHGSQFAVDGTALNAPAVASLDPVEDEH